MSDPNLEKRVTPRKHFRTHATLRSAGKVFTVRTLDVSLGGMAIVCDFNLPAGMSAELAFNVPLATGRNVVPVQVKAIVVHSMFSGSEDGFKTGLKFTGLDDASAAALKQYIG